jgi:IS5 family transposase
VLRALLLQVLHTIRSERQLMEQLDHNLLFRWFVGLNMDDPMWDVTVFTKNRERLLKGNIAQAFFQTGQQPDGELPRPRTPQSDTSIHDRPGVDAVSKVGR